MVIGIQKSANEVESMEAEERGSFWTRSIAIVFALGLTGALLLGYLVLRKRHAERLRAEQAAKTQAVKPAPSPQIQLFVDDAMIKGSQAVLGGTVLNISGEKLSDLAIELELKRRKDGG